LFDAATGRSRPVRLDFDNEHLTVLVVDTRAEHRLADGQYAARRQACEDAAKRLGVPNLGVLGLEDLDHALDTLGPTSIQGRRVRHVVTEDARVRDFVELATAGRLSATGHLLAASHASLRDDFEVSCPELDLAVAASNRAGAIGARMTGGGFGGSIIAIVDKDATGEVAQAVQSAFADAGYRAPAFLVATASPAAGRDA
jgi:galactokinase